uniref:Uncharacterized protein n=1 Tax=Caenorhabditis brenneri TaxID=135651 RepID=B6VBS3_CAEBE|nr:hypothetical protein Cbre_JD22.004 [Caenorhabditis brenneri]
MNHPQKFVFWQLTILSLAKCINFLLSYHFTPDNGSAQNIFQLVTGDFGLFPLISQVTYIGCNRRNLDAFFDLLERSFMDITIDCSFHAFPRVTFCCKPTKVAPMQIQNVYSVNVVNEV